MTAPAPPVIAPPVEVTIDGQAVSVPAGSTLLDACAEAGIDTPTLCYLETLTPVNACRVCVVEVEGSRTLVPSCSRLAEEGMSIGTDTDRVRKSRRMVLEFLASSVEVDLTGGFQELLESYDGDISRYGLHAPGERRDQRRAGHHAPPDGTTVETVSQPVKEHDDLYVRDYSKCILCYKCVEACGVDAQNSFAIAVAGRGFDARISTEFDTVLTESACVYCGNCIGVCPTGALMFKSEFDMRNDGTWDEDRQTVTETICSYCGVGCSLELHVQDNQIVKVTSPLDNDVTNGHLCIKGRFGWQHIQMVEKPEEAGPITE